MGDYKEEDRSKVDDREKETSWNCFLTKFFLTPKSQASIFLTTWVHPKNKKENPLFCLVKKKNSLAKLKWFGKNKLV